MNQHQVVPPRLWSQRLTPRTIHQNPTARFLLLGSDTMSRRGAELLKDSAGDAVEVVLKGQRRPAARAELAERLILLAAVAALLDREGLKTKQKTPLKTAFIHSQNFIEKKKQLNNQQQAPLTRLERWL